MKHLYFLIIFVCLFSASDIFAADVSVRADRTDVNLNESFNIQIILENAEGRIELPEIEGLKVLSTSRNSSIRIINGKVEKKIIHSYDLLPEKKGEIKIPSFKVSTDQGVLSTNEIVINVSDSSVEIPGETSFFAKASFSDSDIFTGEKTEYKITVYSDEKVMKIGFEEPRFEGFKSKRKNDKTYSKVINGKSYSVSEIIYDLEPLKPGKGKIEPVKFEARMNYMDKNSNNSLSNYNVSTKVIHTNPAGYTVKKLPKTDLDSFFTNIIGDIKGYSVLDKKKTGFDDFLNYSIVIEGKGNLSELTLPDLDFSKDYKMYKDKPKFEINNSGKGRVTFNYALVPSKQGTFTIPEFKLRFFNPETEKWEEFKINSQKFTIEGEKKADEKPEKQKDKKKPVILDKNLVKNNNDIISLKEKRSSLFSVKPDFINFLKLYPVSLIIFFVLLFFRKKGLNFFLEFKKQGYIKDLKKLETEEDSKTKIGKIRHIIEKAFMEKYQTNDRFLYADDDLKEFILEIEDIEFSNEIKLYDSEDILNRAIEIVKKYDL
ncbi:MAG: BatD family protein [Thermodesulfobacteriota bacterium]